MMAPPISATLMTFDGAIMDLNILVFFNLSVVSRRLLPVYHRFAGSD